MSRTSTRKAALLLTGFVGLAAPVSAALPAHAATPATIKVVNGTAVVYDAGTGNASNARVFLDRGVFTVTDSVPVTAGSGCTVTSGGARCGTGITGFVVNLGDLDDRLEVAAPVVGSVDGGDGQDTFRSAVRGGPSAVTYEGGAGSGDRMDYRTASTGVTVSLDGVGGDGRTLSGDRDDVRPTVEHLVGSPSADVLTGSERRNTIEGLSGGDSIRGVSGDDHFPQGFVADAGDSISGGEGRDSVSYLDRPTGVLVNVDNLPGDGALGERDNVGLDVEDVTGTRFDDVLVGSAFVNQLSGSLGADHLLGRDGADVVNGGSGDDTLTDNVDGDVDTLVCGAGTDRFADERGRDVLNACETRI
ncbi:calcium-binding protein [Kineococcus indalonis]|uniref:calcium-binding protein n=1 Tax=Kineococcus indalonis TaxID=2696566 RepID=UPI001411FC7B|nr:hypothetical protein [Kineococcus indalonis]NAZ84782.1 hypothetical protein [Kineococcus indalonis]